MKRKLTARKAIVIVATVAWCAAFVIQPGFAHAATSHHTDGSTFNGPTNWGPPPKDPAFSQECTTAIVDPPTYTFVTLHFKDGTTPPPAGVVPVTDDASLVVPYVGQAPGVFTVDVSQQVEGERGFVAYTWNLGTGVTAWVPFDCAPPDSTTTTSTSSTTTVPGSTTTTTIETGGVPPMSAPVPVQSSAIPFTG